jgi:putative ABC transport system substrate-binding protein
MLRRQFLLAACGTALPRLISAAGRNPVVGFLAPTTASEWARYVQAFEQGLHESGFVDSRNVNVEFGWAEGHYERLPAVAAELVRRAVDVIVPIAPPAIRAAQTATAKVSPGSDRCSLSASSGGAVSQVSISNSDAEMTGIALA